MLQIIQYVYIFLANIIECPRSRNISEEIAMNRREKNSYSHGCTHQLEEIGIGHKHSKNEIML